MFKEEDDDGVTKSLGQSLNLDDYDDYRTERMIKHLKRKCRRLKSVYQLLLRVFKSEHYKKRWNTFKVEINVNFKHQLLSKRNLLLIDIKNMDNINKEELLWKKLIVNNMIHFGEELKELLVFMRDNACIYKNGVFKLSYNVNYDLFKNDIQFTNFINKLKFKQESKIYVYGNQENIDNPPKTIIQIPLS